MKSTVKEVPDHSSWIQKGAFPDYSNTQRFVTFTGPDWVSRCREVLDKAIALGNPKSYSIIKEFVCLCTVTLSIVYIFKGAHSHANKNEISDFEAIMANDLASIFGYSSTKAQSKSAVKPRGA